MHGMALPLPSVGHGAMTAALVIVPADPARARSASAHGGQAPGSAVRAVSSRTRPRPREVLSGAPWMVRLSMGCGDQVSPARLAPARKHPLGPHRTFGRASGAGMVMGL
jgi:hypothetical protein